MSAVARPSLLNFLLLPVWPPAWRAAAGWSWGPVLAMFFLTTLASTASSGLWGGLKVRNSLQDEAAAWDTSWDPIVIEGGVLRVEGPRVYQSPDGTAIVDPEDRIDLDTVSDRAVVFGSEEVVQVRAFDRRIYRYRDILSLIDSPSVRIDSASLGAFADKWEIEIVGGSALVGLLFLGVGYGICGVLVALAAAGLLSLWRSPACPPFGGRARVTLAICTLAPPLWALLLVTGVGSSCCLDLVLGVPLVAGLGWLALRSGPTEE